MSNKLRMAPATGAVIAALPAGAVLDVLDGPICNSDGILWWKVYFHGKVGYTAEDKSDTYFIQPVPG